MIMRMLQTTKLLAGLLALLLVCVPFSVSALRGDLDGSGERDAKDYMMLKRFVLGTYALRDVERAAADVNGDGDIDAGDYAMLKRAVLGGLSLESEPPASDVQPDAGNDPELDVLTQTLTRVNAEREQQGLQPLVLSAELCVVAYDKSSDMAQNGYFDHNSPTYGTPAEMLEAYGVQYRSSGENIAAGQQTVSEVMDAWMNSPGHRANILNASYTDMGIGVAYGGEYGIYWTMVLCGR